MGVVSLSLRLALLLFAVVTYYFSTGEKDQPVIIVKVHKFQWINVEKFSKSCCGDDYGIFN